MKIKLDENIPASLISSLSALGHDVDTVPEENIAGEDDKTVWDAAQRGCRFQPGNHYGILLVRLRSPGRSALSHRIVDLFLKESVSDWHGCFLVLSDLKLRIHRPGIRQD